MHPEEDSGAEPLRILITESSLSDYMEENRNNLRRKCYRIFFSVSPAKLYCCYVVIAILMVIVIVLAVSLSGGKTELAKTTSTYGLCPKDWIGFWEKCYYFSENSANWSSSQTFCKEQGAELAQFDSQEELNFTRQNKGPFDYWISLWRERSNQPWRWSDGTEYKDLVPIRGEGLNAYLSDRGISSGKNYIPRKWICSQPYSYILQC